MKHLSLVLLLVVLAAIHTAHAQNTTAAQPFTGLIHQQSRPIAFTKPIPSSAAFFMLDPLATDRLMHRTSGTLAIPDFHLTDREQATLILDRFQVMAAGSSIVAGTAEGDRPVDIDPGAFYTGHVEGMPGSYLYLAVFANYCTGYIEIPEPGSEGKRRLVIAPLDLRDDEQSTMVVYEEHEALKMQGQEFLEKGNWGCGAETLPDYQINADKVFKSLDKSKKSKSPTVQSNTMLVAQIAIDCDGEYYAAHGRNLSRAANYALTVMGAVSAIYQRDINVTLQVPYLRVWTGTDPYPGTTTSTLLPQFRTYWNTNMSGVKRTLVHLFSVSSTGGGIAYLNALCASTTSGFGYAVIGLNNNVTYPTTAYVWDSDVTAHEMGHQFGSPHTHSCNWNPAIDSCYTAEGSCFAGTSPRVGTIMSYCHLTSFGTQLYFHPRVAALMRTDAEAATCISPLDNSTGNDVSVTSISVPATGGKIVTATTFTPVAVFSNPGTNDQSNLTVTFTIKDSAGTQVYSSSQTINSLPAGTDATMNFAPTSLTNVARYFSTVTITLAGDGLSANNTMVRPFEVVASASGTFTITSPNTTTIYKAGSVVNITWTSTGGATNARLDYTPDDGANWYTIRTDVVPGTGSFAWTVPPVATTQARVRIADRDNVSNNDASDQLFTITTIPITWQWARAAGSRFEDDVRAVATDAKGNVYLAGSFTDTIWFGGATLVTAGASDAFVAKYSAGGSFEWAQRIGSTGSDSAFGVAVDDNGNVFVAGGFYNTVTVGANTMVSGGDQDAFLAKYDQNGNPLWAQRAGGSGHDQARGVAADHSGNALVTGGFAGTVTFGAQQLTASGALDAFTMRFTSAGTVDWAQRAGGSDLDEGDAIAVDASGNPVAVGRYRTTGAFGGPSITSAGGDDAFIVRYNTTGATQWAASIGGSQTDDARGVAIDGAGNILVTGGIAGTVQFGTVYVASGGGRDIFLAKYNSAGSLQWARRSGGTGNDFGNGVTVDGFGNAYVMGQFQNTLLVGSLTALGSGGSNDVFVAKYSPDGLPAWVQRGGGTHDEEAYGMIVNSAGDNAYLVGRFPYSPPADQPSIYGDDQLAGLGGNDLVIARLGMFKILSPVESDHWQIGTNRTITWSSMGATTVKVEYSADNGNTWNTFNASAPNTGSLVVTVPNRISTQVMVRVSDADNPSIYGSAQSGTFTIDPVTPPRNLVATPHNGSVTVTWNQSLTQGVTGYAIYRGDLASGVPPSNLVLLATVNSAQILYSDAAVANCNSYVYAAKALAGAFESEFSNLDTARPEAPKTIMSLAPASNEHLSASTTKLVGWSSVGCIDEVRLELSTNLGRTWVPIVTATPNSGGFVWSIPAVSSTRAVIRISDLSDSTVFALSDTFSICGINTTVPVTGPTTLCQGDSVTLTAPDGYGAYLWSNGASTRSIVVKKAGSFSVTVADTNGCSASSQPVSVTVNTVLAPKLAASGSTAFCAGDTAILDAGAGYARYLWSTGDTTRTIRVGRAGTYFAFVTSGGGCSGVSDSINVVVHIAPAKPVIVRRPAGDSLAVTAPSGVIQWTLNGTPITGLTARTLRITQIGTYRVSLVDSNGCSSISDSIQVQTLPASVAIETGEGRFAIHPNPSSGLFTIEAELTVPSAVQITLTDMAGKEHVRVDVPRASGTYHHEIDARAIPAGAYILDVRAGDRHWSRKIVKQ